MRDFTGEWVPADDPKDAMFAQFYVDAVIDKDATAKARAEDPAAMPVWKDVAFARMRSSLDPKSEWNKEVDGQRGEEIKHRFAKAWATFEHGALGELSGTPLQQWGAIPKSVVKGLNQQGLLSVEDVAAVPDNHLPILGKGGSSIREQARVFLKPKDQAVAALEQDNDDLRRQLQELSARMDQMMNMPAVEAGGDAPKKRGRPPMNKALES